MVRWIVGVTVLVLGLLGVLNTWAADFDATVFRDGHGTVLAVAQVPAGQVFRSDHDVGVQRQWTTGVGPEFFAPFQTFTVEAIEGLPGAVVYLNEGYGARLEYAGSRPRLVVPDPAHSRGAEESGGRWIWRW